MRHEGTDWVRHDDGKGDGMPRRMLHDVIIAQPITVVFIQLTRLDQWPEWVPTVLDAYQTSAGPLGVGATFTARMQDGARTC